MCGIAGFLGDGDRGVRGGVVQRMARSLRHRGPDDEGFYLDESLALGARRLSVIDPATGRQPLSNENGSVWVVHNGEIYNFRELRERLEGYGHRFRTASDTEVIAHAYEQYGEDCVAHLDGMFAFAVWDVARRMLLLARDRMGEKPLYYYAGPEVFVFGSELRSLLEHPGVPHALSLEGLSRYLAFEYIPAPCSILTNVKKLPPGYLLTVSPGSKPHLARYWDLAFSADSSVDEEEWADRLARGLETSVRSRLVSDVPVGLFLSGGVDSAAMVAMAARFSPGRALKTFTIGFSEPSYDERAFARAVATQFGADHEETVFSAQDALRLFEDVGHLLDEPIVDTSFLPIYVLSRTARRAVTVALSGDGGDELFCGYPTFLADRGVRWVERLPKGLQHWAARAVTRLPASAQYASAEYLLKQFFRGLGKSPEVRTQLLLGGLTAREQSGLFSAGVRATLADFDPHEEVQTVVEEVPGGDPISRMIYQHCKYYLAGQNLVAVDRASMACGLEVRAPFLSPALVELAGRIPPHLKLRGWRTKHILKRALRGLVPASVLDRRKQGFGVPVGAWLRGPLRGVLRERLAPDRVARLGLFDPAATSRLVTEHMEARADHRKLLWALLMFDAWREHYLPEARWT